MAPRIACSESFAVMKVQTRNTGTKPFGNDTQTAIQRISSGHSIEGSNHK